MSYLIRAALSNSSHPEYGQVTVPFPIPDDQYDQTMERLASLGIGDVLAQDCQVDELDSYYTVLNRLKDSAVNVDALDYLAKRLESFDEYEALQFQGMAAKLDLTDMTDLVNLTFSCQQATVITSFTDLEQVGRNHCMSLHGGAMPAEEYRTLDGRAEVLKLLQSGQGTITPYGIVYDNGVELKPLYNGRQFPGYLYKDCLLAFEITPKQGAEAVQNPEYLYLPASNEQIERTMLRAGIECVDDMQLCTKFDNLPEQVDHVLTVQYENISALNEMCRTIAALDDAHRAKLEAVVLLAKPENSSEVRQLAENLEQFDFLPGSQNTAEYQQINALGYVAYHGVITLDELMREDPAEQYQREQGLQMGQTMM